jgi:hypothetical protein
LEHVRENVDFDRKTEIQEKVQELKEINKETPGVPIEEVKETETIKEVQPKGKRWSESGIVGIKPSIKVGFYALFE